MDTFDKVKKSWWVLFPFTLMFPGFGFIYVGLKSSNKNWILEGITYELPFFFYFLASSMFPSAVMVKYYIWIILLAAFIALLRSIMLAIKLLDVYELDETPRVSQTASHAGSSRSYGGSRASRTVEKVKDKDSNLGECCCCVIAIFIIFAIIGIL